jgi:hypothetical protein
VTPPQPLDDPTVHFAVRKRRIARLGGALADCGRWPPALPASAALPDRRRGRIGGSPRQSRGGARTGRDAHQGELGRVVVVSAHSAPKRLRTAPLSHGAECVDTVEGSHFPPLRDIGRHSPANPVEVQVLSSA